MSLHHGQMKLIRKVSVETKNRRTSDHHENTEGAMSVNIHAFWTVECKEVNDFYSMRFDYNGEIPRVGEVFSVEDVMGEVCEVRHVMPQNPHNEVIYKVFIKQLVVTEMQYERLRAFVSRYNSLCLK